MKIQLTDLIQCSVDRFWEALTRRIEITPKLELPSAAKKIVGSVFATSSRVSCATACIASGRTMCDQKCNNAEDLIAAIRSD